VKPKKQKVRRRRVEVNRIEFVKDWSNGPRIVIDENDDYVDGRATRTTTIPLKTRWEAMWLMEQARLAVLHFRTLTIHELKTIDTCLEGKP
jgi:hypothetical protein